MFNQPSTPNNDTLPITPSLIDQRSTPKNDSTHKVCEDVPALSREEFEDGKQISQIEYHGDLHNHPKPQNVGTAFGVDGLLEEDFDITGT